MAKLKQERYLMHLRDELRKKGYTTKVGYEDRIGGDRVLLTANKDKDYFKLRLEKGIKTIAGDYKISIFTNNTSMLSYIRILNNYCRKKTSFLKLKKKKFHNKINQGIDEIVGDAAKYQIEQDKQDKRERRKETAAAVGEEAVYVGMDVGEMAFWYGLEMNMYGMAPAVESAAIIGEGTGAIGEGIGLAADAGLDGLGSDLEDIVGAGGGSFLGDCGVFDSIGDAFSSCDIGGCDFSG